MSTGYGDDYIVQSDKLFKRNHPCDEFLTLELNTFAEWYFVTATYTNQHDKISRGELGRFRSLVAARELYDSELYGYYKDSWEQLMPITIDEMNAKIRSDKKEWRCYNEKTKLEQLLENIENGIRRIDFEL